MSVAVERESNPGDGLARMAAEEAARLCSRFGVTTAQQDLATLTRLQWEWLKWSPFHNLDLLAGASGFACPLDAEDSLRRVLEGAGGPCHVQATAFIALLRALGFDAWLAAASIGAPNDHLVAVVALPDDCYVCDVGNGHPYVQPFPLQRVQEIERYGWRFRSAPCPGGLVLRRRLPDGRWRQVYTVDPTPRGLAFFESTIRLHHGTAGFGPFLSGLRAVRMDEHVMLTLRDRAYTRHLGHLAQTRPIESAEAAELVLRERFGVPTEHFELVLASLERARPDLWEGRISVPRRRPRVLVMIGTMDRPASLRLLVGDVTRAWQAAPEELRLLVLDNSATPACRVENAATVTAVEVTGVQCLLVRATSGAQPIAVMRRELTRAASRWLGAGIDADVAWMLDDDLRLRQLIRTAEGGLREADEVDYREAIGRLWREHPEVSVAIGDYHGDPPIRPHAVLCTQLLDMERNLLRFQSLRPADVYPHPASSETLARPDYYYDHSMAGSEHVDEPVLFAPVNAGAGLTCLDALCGYLDAAAELPLGRVATRPLAARDHARVEVGSASTNRGGLVLFLDLDACLLHTYPAVTAGARASRRSDMVGLTRLARSRVFGCYGASLPALHGRGEQLEGEGPDFATIAASMRAEFIGVLLARLSTMPAGEELQTGLLKVAQARAGLILERLIEAGRRLEAARVALESLHVAPAWRGVSEVSGLCAELGTVLRALRRTLLGPEHVSLLRAVFADCTREDAIAELIAAWDGFTEWESRERRAMEGDLRGPT